MAAPRPIRAAMPQEEAATPERARGAPSAAAAALPPPLRWGLLINPLSFELGRRRRSGATALRRLAGEAGIRVSVVEDRDSVDQALEALLADGVELIAVAGGDGTMQAVVSGVAALPAATRPAVMLLGGGRTNLTSRDLAPPRPPASMLARALQAGRTQPGSAYRHALRISQPGMRPEYGFFLAGALVDHLIRDCHRYREEQPSAWRKGRYSTAWFLLRSAVAAAAGGYRPEETVLAIDAGDLGRLATPISLLAVSTLRHERGLLNPYAERGRGALRLSAVRRGAAGFWHRVPRLLCGRPDNGVNLASGYLTGRCERIRIDGLSRVTLDGQPLELDPTGTLEITTGPELRFIQP